MIDRPGMRDMLAFLMQYQKITRGQEKLVVIIDDLSRFSRDIVVHWQLRELLGKAGGKLESPTMKFGESSDDKLIENLLASVSQHQREKNGEQVVNRMSARCSAGYWVFQAPTGYRYKKTKEHGKLLVRNEPVASLLQEALEGYATARFESQSEVRRFLLNQPEFPKDSRGDIHLSRVTEWITHPIYAGRICHARWDIHMVEGKHEPLITLETWKRNQERFSGRSKGVCTVVAPSRKDTRPDFPLRGFVTCSSCGNPLTASWSKGRSARYGYYFCQAHDCPQRRKNIRKIDLEGDFEALIQTLIPDQLVIDTAFAMLKDLWKAKGKDVSQAKQAVRKQILRIDAKMANLMDRLLNTAEGSLVALYEAELRNLEEAKLVLTEKAAKIAKPTTNFDGLYRTACEFLANPYKLWASSDWKDQRIFLRLIFAGHIAYCRESGYRTAKTTLPFNALREYSDMKSGMVELSGIEPLTS